MVENSGDSQGLQSIEQKLDKLSASVDQRFERMDERFEQMDQRFAQVDQRFAEVDLRFVQIDLRSGQVHQRFSGIEAALVEQRAYTEFAYERLDKKMDAGFARLERKLDQIIDLHSPDAPE